MAKLKLGVDVGGTFTDVVGINEDGKVYFAKTPSTPEDQSIGVLNGIRALLEELGVAPDCVTGVAHGTTVATNTLLERNGAVTALITTKGFRDLSCLIINGMGDAASGLISMFVVSPAFLFTVKERRNVVKFLKKLDHIVEFVVGNLAGILLIVMMIMVNLTIFSRWVFNINMHGYEELPTILFIVFVWLGVILVVRDDNMLKVDFFLNLCKTEKSKEALHLFSLIISTIICGLFMPLTFNLMMTHIERNTVSPAVGFSMWWVYASVFLGALGMMVYYVVNVCKSIRRLRTL